MQPQWVPTNQTVRDARLTDFAGHVARRTGTYLDDYYSLWRWSTDNLADFWGELWNYFDVGPPPRTVLAGTTMPAVQWFPGTRLNYADYVARQANSIRPAIIHASENGAISTISWSEMLQRTAAFARALHELGVQPGDHVVGYLPNIPEAVIAFLGTAALGAVWGSCGQDYTAKAAIDRLGQLHPTVLVTADGYRYAGKEWDKRAEITALQTGFTQLRATVVVPRLGRPVSDALDWASVTKSDGHQWHTHPVDFGHPLWVLFSSGTTGPPKGIVHGHGGVTLEHLKALALHSDLGPRDTFFWFTSPSWMMWNMQVSGLLVGATIVCYDGSPTYPASDALWKIAAVTGATLLGMSPGYVRRCIKDGVLPACRNQLSRLRTVGITGSPLPPSSSLWLRDHLGAHVQVASISGGTDVASAFAGAAPTVPVWPGELSVPYLGVALDCWDTSGRPVRDEVGELVITQPMPSMPLRFFNDPDGSRYTAAYFDEFPGVWRHGDFITITKRGSIVIHGRSDSTLNRNGVRMGSAEIYRAVEQLPEVAEALVVGVELPDGGYWMPLFVVPADGIELTDEIKRRVADVIRDEISARYMPDDIFATPAVPHTRTGKKLEVPIKKILQGADPERVVERGAIDNPDVLAWYATVPTPPSLVR
ncbi:acetoacetate--CoA ligase [Mycobacterium lentiflavum]|uniref:Acetoacetate--CoA ligase n=1 Tax=Mycobacterium lentiflavum TaxID=141349 RepID=A0ABY3UQ71_MYCLN|nr:acetoacetate--CoA ligase [Mycobacterium lentiflavum]ULP41600.1 acetoacetate--CoA ligase [Mycobacterium lentiflavum]